MNKLYDQVKLSIQSEAYHLISFNGEDLGEFRFQEDPTLLTSDGSWKKIKAYINETTLDGYLDIFRLEPKDEPIVITQALDLDESVKNAREINKLAIQNLSIKSEDKDFLFSLMELGINYEEYQSNPCELASNFFKGESTVKKLEDYLQHFDRSSFEKKIILKRLICSFISKAGANDINFWPKPLFKDKEIMIAAIQQNWLTTQFMSNSFRNDKDVMMAAIIQDSRAFLSASDNLKSNKEFVLLAVKIHGYNLIHANYILKNNKKIVLEAVKQDGLAISCASLILRNNKKVILAAINQNGLAIKYASDELKNDKEIALKAVKKNGFAIKYVSDDLKDDEEVVLEAIRQNGFVINSINIVSQNNPIIILTSNKQISFQLISKINPINEFSHINNDQIIELIENYERFKSDSYSINGAADLYIKNIIENKTKKAEDAKNFIFNNIRKNNSIEQSKKQDYFKSLTSHLELEAACLKHFGIDNFKTLRLILPMVKKIMSYRNKEIKDYFIEIIKRYSGKQLNDFLKKLTIISNGKPDLILPSIVLGTLNINKETQNDLYNCLESKISIFKDQTKPLLQSLINLEKTLKKINFQLNEEKFDYSPESTDEILFFDDENIANIIKIPFTKEKNTTKKIKLTETTDVSKDIKDYSSDEEESDYIDDYNEIVKKLNLIQSIAIADPVKLTLTNDFSYSNLLDILTDQSTKLGILNTKIEYKNKFLKIFFNSRIPHAIFTYINKFSNDSEILSLIKEFVDGVTNSTYTSNRHNNNSHNHLLTDEQKLKWESGEIKKLNDDSTLTIKDTEDWQDLFFCGTEALGTCQRVDGDPEFSKCLLGYVLDGKIRMIKISENDEITIARAIIKIMKDSLDKPVIFLEKSYPPNKHDLAIKEFAKQRSKTLKMDLYEYDPYSSIKLKSEGNIALNEYEDASDVGTTSGAYEINAKLII